MTENNMEKRNVTFLALLEAAKREEWGLVDDNVGKLELTEERLKWILTVGIFDKDKNIRDFSATLLDQSDIVLTRGDLEFLEERMMEDSYDIVQYRLAIALYKRDYQTAEVEEMMQKAKDDPNVGEEAKKYLK